MKGIPANHAARSLRGRFRPFAIGRRWWLVPVVLMAAQLVAYFLLKATTRFHGDSVFDWALLIVLLIGSPTLAAILLSPGFRWPHAAMALPLASWGGLVFWIEHEFHTGIVFVGFMVAAVQAFVLRMSRTPPWVIRPVRPGRQHKVSIVWLMAMTAFVAVMITLIRHFATRSIMLTLASYLSVAIFAAMAGNYLAVLPSSRTRYIVLGISVFLGTVGYWLLDSGYVVLGDAAGFLPRGNQFAKMILCVAPPAALAVVTLVHRAMLIKPAPTVARTHLR